MTLNLNGKVAAVTGAASGIGLECAKAMLAAGATVVLIDRAGDKLASICKDLGPHARPLVIDLLDPASVNTMLPGILAAAGGLISSTPTPGPTWGARWPQATPTPGTGC